MPKDTPPPAMAAPMKPKIQQQAQVVQREPTPSPQQKPVIKAPEPEIKREGPSATIEEAFLRAGATVVEAAPVLRDFQKEATSLVPSVVKRRPQTKKLFKKTEQTEIKDEKSFATSVEDEDQEVSTPIIEQNVAAVVEDTSVKRALESETKVEPIPAPSKRRRMLNAAPDV